MARYFEIGASTAKVKLDSQGRGTVQYRVKNVSAAPIDGRALLISLPVTNPPSGPVQNRWVSLEPPTDRAFEKEKQETFVVKIEVPPKDKSKAGTYTFRLDVVTVTIPDRGDEGPAVSFTLDPAAETRPKSVLGWLIPLIVVLVIAIGVGAWLALRNTGPKVPDAGPKVPEAAPKVPEPAATTPKETAVPVPSGPATNVPLTPAAVPAPAPTPTEPDGFQDPRLAKGEALCSQDPLAKAILNAQPDPASRTGFLLGMAAAEGQTLDGPGKQAQHDALPASEKDGFTLGVQYSIARNRNSTQAAIGAIIAKSDPKVAAASNSEGPGLYALGFNIGTGIFGPSAMGAQGNTAVGPGAYAIRDALDPSGRRGFNAAMTFFHITFDRP